MIYLYGIGFAAVVFVLLFAGLIGLWSREYKSPEEEVRARTLSEEERVSLRNLRDINLREAAQAKVFAKDPDQVSAEFLAKKASKKAAKAARKIVVRQVAEKMSEQGLPDKG